MIQTTITALELQTVHSVAAVGFILQRLRENLIPVAGVLQFRGVLRGTLWETCDFRGNLVYTWME